MNCQEMGSYGSNKCNHPMYCNERQHRTWKLRGQWESNSSNASATANTI